MDESDWLSFVYCLLCDEYDIDIVFVYDTVI